MRRREVVGAEQLRHGQDAGKLHELLVLAKVPLALGRACCYVDNFEILAGNSKLLQYRRRAPSLS